MYPWFFTKTSVFYTDKLWLSFVFCLYDCSVGSFESVLRFIFITRFFIPGRAIGTYGFGFQNSISSRFFLLSALFV